MLRFPGSGPLLLSQGGCISGLACVRDVKASGAALVGQARLNSAVGLDAWQSGHNDDMRLSPGGEGAEEPSRSLWLVMEYCSLGTLQVRAPFLAALAVLHAAASYCELDTKGASRAGRNEEALVPAADLGARQPT